MTKQNNDTHEKLQFFSDNLRRLFSPYLSDSAIEEIAANPARLQLNGARRYMTAMFTGVKDFLNIAESMQPENLVNLLNIYLSTMSDAILEQKGMIDKYEGGSIIAFFGAPLEERGHALRACASALFIKRLEKEINHKTRKMPLFTRAGIITGNMVVGNMGSEHKKNYTITGKSVHLAARLESMNKQYGTWILITETTFQETGGRVFARRLDRVRMAGIDEPVRIYELLEFSDMVTATRREWVSVFHEGLAQFEALYWRGAAKLFIRVLKLNPSDRPARLFYERAVRYVKTPPAVNWDGVFSVSQ
jgi:class 3 adenylate cyclase